MATTVWLDRETHARLAEIKHQRNFTSLGQVIRSLLDAPAEDAKAIFERNRARAMPVIKKHGITKVVAFGSRARGDATAESDLDLAIQVPRATGLEIVTIFAEMKAAFDVPTDVIELGAPRMRRAIKRDGVVLYAG